MRVGGDVPSARVDANSPIMAGLPYRFTKACATDAAPLPGAGSAYEWYIEKSICGSDQISGRSLPPVRLVVIKWP